MDKKQHHQLLDIIQKRDYYNNKLYDLLDKAAEQTDPNEILDVHEASHFIKKRLMKDKNAVDRVKALIDKHVRFQKDMAMRQQEIRSRYEDSAVSSVGLSKLKLIGEGDKRRKALELERELKDFYMNIAEEQTKQFEESESALRLLGVPFFVLADDDSRLSLEDLAHHKKKVLSSLQKHISPA